MSEPSTKPDFDDLLEHRGWVRRLCRQLVAQPADADEVEQETWRRALAAPPRHGRNVKAWLSAVVRSVSAQKWRSDARRRAAYDRLGQHEGAKMDGAVGAPDLLEQRESFAVLTRAVLELESPYGEVVFLRYVEDLPPRVIAERLGLPVGTVKTRLHRGLAMLRSRVTHQLGDDWRARLLVFTPSMSAASAAAFWTTVMTLTKTKVAAATAAVVLVAAAFQLLPYDADSTTGSEDVTVAIEDAPAEDVTTSSAALAEPRQLDRTRLEENATSNVTPQTGPIHRFQVVDAVTREPRPDAEALVVDYSQKFAGDHSLHGYQLSIGNWDTELMAERFGVRVELDHEGWGVMPQMIEGHGYRVVARTDECFGESYSHRTPMSNESLKIEVRLAERIHLPVHVNYPNGDPAPNVDVGWGSLMSGGPEQFSGFERARTDQHGNAVFRNLKEDQLKLGGRTLPFVVMARLPSVGIHWIEVDMEREPLADVVLTVPRTIPLEVRVPSDLTDDHSGEWFGLLESADGMPKGGSFVGPLSGDVRHAEELLLDGAVRFPHVEPGFQGYFLVPLRKGDGYEKAIWQWVEIPEDATDLVRVVLEEPVAVDPIELCVIGLPELLQAPLKWHVVLSALATEERLQQEANLIFDEQARADLLEVTSYRFTHPDRRPYMIELNSEQVDGRVHSLIAQVDLAETIKSTGVVEVPFHNDLIASGRFVDSNGEPIEGLTLNCNAGRFYDPSSFQSTSLRVRLTTARDGYFELRGDRERFDGRMSVSSRGARSRQMRFEVGAAMQTFVYSPESKLEGSVWLDPGVPVPLCSLLDRQGNQAAGQLSTNAVTGRLGSHGLQAGEVQLVIRDYFDTEIFRSDFFELREGETARPDDLQRIDLRGVLHAHRVRGYGPDGKACAAVWISLPDTGYSIDFSPDRAIATVEPSFIATVEAEGMLAQSGFEISGDCRIDFEAGLDLSLYLPEGIADETGHREWVVVATKPRDRTQSEHRVVVPVIEGRNHVLLPASGEWALALGWRLKRKQPDPSRAGYRIQMGRASQGLRVTVAIEAALPESLIFEWPLDVETARAFILSDD